MKASGSLTLYMTVSKTLKGTCSTVNGVPTLELTDPKNEFFDGVSVTVQLSSDLGAVAAVKAELGEDTEGTAWRMTYDASSPTSGASATLVTKGRQFTVSGKALLTEQDTKSGELSPYSVSVTCAAGEW